MANVEFKIGELIESRYRVLSIVGSGWMGTVYRVSDKARDGQIVALKTVNLDRPAAEISESIEHFQREFKILTQLQHPNLVAVHNYGVTAQGALYFTMEWIQGQEFKPTRPPLKPAGTIPLIVQACRALAYLHSRGVIHGNLKPSHVLITGEADPQVKIVDFGVALEARSPQAQSQFYTPHYSAPEVKGYNPLDHRADLYSLGAMWYQLLTGELPQFMQGPGRERLIALTLAEALEGQQQLSPQIAPVIAKMLSTAPGDRYASANEIIEAVNKAIGSNYALETRETARSYALRASFVNRQAELELLQTLWEQARSTGGKLTLIGGETGVGKTRLLEELETQVELTGARAVWGQCVESGGSAYHPWREVLRVLTHYIESADKQFMREMGPVLSTVQPELWKQDYMAGLEPPDELDSTAAQQRLNNAIVQVLQTAAHLRPTMIVIEDAQWADEATLALLSFLERIPGQAGLLVCATYRTDEIGPEHLLATLSGERLQRIELGRLQPEVTTDLACSMLGLKELPSLLTEQLQQTTRGNALFVQELIRSLAEDGLVLKRTADGWQVNHDALQAAQLPESIRQVVRQRLAQLSTQASQVLGWAAVMGAIFWEDGAAQVGQSAHSSVRAALREAAEQELIVERDESTIAGDREYLFSTLTIQELSYEDIPPEERPAYHSRAAAWLMARSDEHASERLGLIADHLEKAKQPQQAATYLYRAGEQAARQFANTEAIAYFNRALNLISPNALSERYDLLLARERVYDLQGARKAQRQDLETLNELARKLGDSQRQAQATLRQSYHAWTISNYPLSIVTAQEAIRLARLAQDTTIEAASYLQWGQALWRLGDLAACRAQLEQALTLARAAKARQWEADSLRILGNVYYYLGDYAQAAVYWEQALPISRQIGDRPGEASALSNLGEAARSQGSYAQARDYYEQRLRICQETGERYGESIALINLSLVSHNLGNNQPALEYSQQALQLTQKIGIRTHQAYALTNMGHALEGLARWAEAADAYQHAAATRLELGEHHLAMESTAGLARVLLAQGDTAQAMDRVNEILHHLESETLDGTDEPLRIYLCCYRVLRANHDPHAQSILQTAHHLLQQRAAKISDEALRRSFLENVNEHREIMLEFANRETGKL